jgi:hypothetical protein
MAKRGHIYHEPFKLSTVELSNGTIFQLVHNIEKTHGSINSVEAAIIAWCARTKVFTQESFIEYINSKGVHEAMSKEEADAKHIHYER